MDKKITGEQLFNAWKETIEEKFDVSMETSYSYVLNKNIWDSWADWINNKKEEQEKQK